MDQINLPEPEDYNVLHLGLESSMSELDKSIISSAKKSRISSLVVFLSLASLCFGLVLVNASMKTSVQKNEQYITSLIDEVGALTQENLMLGQQLESQEAVLQTIETEFGNIHQALVSSDGDFGALSSVFASVLGEFEKTEVGSALSKTVELSEVVKDGTFDILILGTNGAHTDTIMVASINSAKEKVTLFSIPRDLYINGRRINGYYYYYGADQLERMVESVTGLYIDQYVQVDLDGFTAIVDILGGLDIYVDSAIYDGLYPNVKGGYTAYSIDVGYYHMDGTEALKYARSRKSTSDFDRAARQQDILKALKEKLVQLDSVMEMKELTQLFQAGLEYTDTDIHLFDLVSYYYDYKDFDLETGFVLDTSNYLYSMINESGAYILLPKTGDFEEIKGVISQLVN